MTEQENMQELRNYFVYEIRRPLETNDPRKYVGISSYTKHGGPKKRFNGHRKSSYYVGFFIRKYPDVKMYILHDNLTKEEACVIEKSLVPKTDKERKELNLLNETEGGGIPPKFSSLSQNTQDSIREKRKINAQKQTHVSKRPPGPEHVGSKEYRLLDPNGILHEGKCLQELCRKYNLKHPNLSKVNTGKMKSYMGWTSPDYVDSFHGPQKGEQNKISKKFKLRSPTGEVFEGIGLKFFCEKNHLNYDGMLKVVNGTRYEWNGWTNPDSNLNPKEIKSYTIISPDNKTYTFSNISAFERDHGFKPGSLWNLLSNKTINRLGWTTPESKDKRKEYIFIDPSGNEHKTYSLVKFAKEHSLNADELSRLCLKKKKSYKGWTLPGVAKPQKRKYVLIDPQNNIHETYSLNKFCKENKLCQTSMCELVNGNAATYLNWTTPEMRHKRKEYVFIDSNGIKHTTYNVKDFAKSNGLEENKLYKLLQSSIPEYAGWTIPNSTYERPLKKVWIIISPNGEEIKTSSLREFCTEQNLVYTSFYEIILGRQKQHKGWSLKEIIFI